MDDEDEFCPGIDGCHHGLGFDEDCEWCDYEIADEAASQRAALRAARDPQADLFGPQQPQPPGDA
jgi:hypothetical protein